MILQEKIQKKAEGFGKLAPVFLEGAKFALDSRSFPEVQWSDNKPTKVKLVIEK